MTLKQTKEHALYLVRNKGSCAHHTRKISCDECSTGLNQGNIQCSRERAYEVVVEWLIDNGYKDDLLEHLI